MTYGVRPLVAMPTRTSAFDSAIFLRSSTAMSGPIFGAFHRGVQRGVAAGDHADDLRRVRIERRRAFDGIEHAEPAGCAGA